MAEEDVGYFTRLLGAALRAGNGDAAGRLPDLWAFRDNGLARRFYEAHGCRPVRQTDGADDEEHMPDALYEWLPSLAA